MKKILTSIALLGLLTVGCTNADDIISSTDETPGADIEDVAGGATSYLTFGLVTTSGTRALPNDNPDGNNYEYGKKFENSVKNIRFYFFDNNGDPVNVKKNPAKQPEYDSFCDYSEKLNNLDEDFVTDEDDDSSLTVEKTINITLMLTPEKEKMPTRVIAILNPTEKLIADKTNYTQDELVALTANYLPDPDKLKLNDDGEESEENKGQFVITSSVYAKESEKINYTTIKLKDGDLYQSVEEARNNKTTIFVERVVARIDLTVGKSPSKEAENPIIPVENSGLKFDGDTKDVYYTNKMYKKYNSPESDGEPIFVKFLGWTVTSTPVKSYLVKEIDPTWKDVDDNNGLFNKVTEPWNIPNYYRSFWAVNPALTPAYSENIKNKQELGYEFYSYNDIIEGGSAYHSFATGNESATMYIQENAADATEGYSVTPGLESKVIVAAQLLKPDGKPREIVEYGFMYYDADELLQYFADQLSLVFYTNKDDKKGSGLKVTDIEYKTQAKYLEKEGVDVTGGYLSYVALTKPATGNNENKWYRDNDKGEAELQTETQVNEYIQGVVSNHLLYWKDGKTYYYFPIQHLGGLVADAEGEPGPGPGYYGVVRNHIYKANISGLTGLGTPVLDPNETIYPEHPIHDDYLLAAEIKVLAWRIVQQDYEFTW